MDRDSRARISDFALKIATVNGTGSASANGLLMQAVFRMGVPVSGKNAFPSNIQGLPTWYEIRVNKDGYGARASHFDVIVAMNPKTHEQDIAEYAKRVLMFRDGRIRRDYVVESRRNAEEVLADLPDEEEEEEDE